MNGDHERQVGIVDALLGDRPVRVRVVDMGDDRMSSVGLADKLDLKDALEVVAASAKLLYDTVEQLGPTTASVEFGVSFGAQSGKLTALLFDGRADASMTIRLQWERSRSEREAAGDA